MDKKKELIDISWRVSEEEYRALKSISYSTISTFAREGYKGLRYLGVSKDHISLRYGSLVDTLLTEPENLKSKFEIVNYNMPSDDIIKILNEIMRETNYQYNDLNQIKSLILLECIDRIGYGAANWKAETKINKIIEAGNNHFKLLVENKKKIIVADTDVKFAKTSVEVMKSHKFTQYLFENNPLKKTYFQLKFQLNFNGIPLKCMFDMIYVDYENKIIYPIDFKTTSKDESEFQNSFLQWRYDIQATMYSFILREICKQDEFFKDFKIEPFKFLVINKYNNLPLFWQYDESVEFKQSYIAFNDKLLLPWYEMIDNIYKHLNEDQYSYPYEALNNEGVIKLKKNIYY